MVRFITLLITVFFMAEYANAVVTTTYFNERVALQGYITASGGSSLDGNYKMKITLKRASGVTFWEKTFNSQPITNGVFSVTISGNDDLGPTALTADLFDLASGAQSLQMDVVVDVDLDTVLEAGETFSAIPIVAVPTAMLADRCNTAINVIDDAIGTSKIEDTAVTMAKLNQSSASSGQVITWNGSAWAPASIPTPTTFSGSIAGDVSGTVGATSVDKIKGGTLTISSLAANELLVYNGSAWVNKKIDSASMFSGTMDLSSNLTGTTYAIDITGNAATATTATTAGAVSGAIDGAQLDAASVDLTTKVTGTLPVANGGTGSAAALTANTLMTATSTTVMTSLANGSQYNVMVGGASGVPTWGQVSLDQSAAVSGALGAANGGTGLTSYTTGDVTYASGATAISKLAIGTAGQVLTVNSGATAPQWSTINQESSRTQIYMWEDFIGGVVPTITAATNTLLSGSTFLTNVTVANGAVTRQTGTANRVGILRVSTAGATTTNQRVGVGFCSSTTGGTPINTMRFEATTGDSWTLEASVAPLSVTNSQQGSWWVGLMASNPTALTTMNSTIAGAYFEVLSASAATITPYARKTATYTGSTSTATANTFVNLKIVYTGGSPGTIEFFVDGVSKGSTSTATNIADATALCPIIWRVTDTTTATGLDIDYLGWKQVLSTR